MGFLSVLSQAQRWVKERTLPGDIAVDATAGNGSDTLFLARTVGPKGTVFAFDIQAEALESTRRRLESEAMQEELATVALVREGHENMSEAIPVERHGRIAAVMFNLGYLPGAESDVITHPASTLAALESALRMLRPGGIVTVVVYPGHEGGQTEADAVSSWAEAVSPAIAQTVVYRFPQKLYSPYLIALNKK
ncbi:methyltransferase domain-containing protein [Cohnella endophytica]|uniref:Methyltransferase domain-containing protein n=1 Tax=Cohnella endophytica TaxID=2419778 RepID=A0A494XTB5_9BACL|nr:class I SAM-dependent methyltransferase [Cohnella endophytica]RKP53881.1 methyltransferase domain-containing protein [Cohnella endophytica]